MQSDYEPFVALYKYGFRAALSAASAYFEFARQLRTLQLNTDKDMLAFVQGANAEIDNAASLAGLWALQQKMLTQLMGRELSYVRDVEKAAQEASADIDTLSADSKNPWQDRIAQVTEEAAEFLAHGDGKSASARAGT